MKYRKLGNSGLSVSEISFGSWVTFGKQMQLDSVKQCLKLCLDKGINFFDNAEVYAHGVSESVMAEAFQSLGVSRNEYIITSKFFWGIENRINFQNTLNRKYLFQAVENSLKRLKTNFIDVIYCHRYDPETPIHEIVESMDIIIKQGKALYWGTSEWPANAISEAYDYALQNGLQRPIVEQPQYNLLYREKVESDYNPLYKKMKLGLTTWSPLASGQLTGKYLDGVPKDSRVAVSQMSWLQEEIQNSQNRSRVEKLSLLAKKNNVSMTHLALGWCLLNQNVSTVITGASRIEQIEDNLNTLNHLSLIRDLKTELDRV